MLIKSPNLQHLPGLVSHNKQGTLVLGLLQLCAHRLDQAAVDSSTKTTVRWQDKHDTVGGLLCRAFLCHLVVKNCQEQKAKKTIAAHWAIPLTAKLHNPETMYYINPPFTECFCQINLWRIEIWSAEITPSQFSDCAGFWIPVQITAGIFRGQDEQHIRYTGFFLRSCKISDWEVMWPSVHTAHKDLCCEM